MHHSLWQKTVLFLGSPHHGFTLVWLIFGAAILGMAGLFVLMSVPPRYRKTVVAAITFVGGLYFSLEFLLPHKSVAVHGHVVPGTRAVSGFANWLTAVKPSVADWAMIIGSFALLLGISNLFQIHGKTVSKRAPGWYNSAAFFVSFFLIMIAGFVKDYSTGAVQETGHQLYKILFNGFMQTLDAAMFSLIAFYIVSAAYRAFRVRSTEAALMMATAGIVMLGIVPVGAWLTSWLPQTGWASSFRLEHVIVWLLTWPNMAVQRAINFGLGVGALAMSLRIWLNLERGSFFDRQL